MNDTISRRMAIEKFEPWLKVDGYSEGELNMLKAVLYELRFLPSAQPEIIRCKDCKHYTEPNIECCELYGAMILWSKDDFCSRGERRTDEEIIHQYHERHKEVLKEMSMPVGRNVMDALREGRTDE